MDTLMHVKEAARQGMWATSLDLATRITMYLSTQTQVYFCRGQTPQEPGPTIRPEHGPSGVHRSGETDKGILSRQTTSALPVSGRLL